MNKKIVNEIIQNKFTTEIIANELKSILNGKTRKKQLYNYSKLKKKLSDYEDIESIGKKIVSFLK